MHGKSVTVATAAAALEGGKKSEATPRSAKAARSESQTAGELWHETDTTMSTLADWEESGYDPSVTLTPRQ